MPKTIPSKVQFIEDILLEKRQLFVALTETWLRDETAVELAINGYKLLRSDRKRKKKNKGRNSGGVALYLREDIAATTDTILEYSNGVIEFLVVYSKQENLLITVLYRQPNDSSHGNLSTKVEFADSIKTLNSTLSSIKGETPDVVLCGDFNLPGVNWPDETVTTATPIDIRNMFDDLKQLNDEYFLSQVINHPTHKDGNVLDLLFNNNTSLIHDIDYFPVLRSTSDHLLIECTSKYKYKSKLNIEIENPPPLNPLQIYNFFSESTKWDDIYAELANYDWNREFRNELPHYSLNKCLTVCLEIIENYVPKRYNYDNKKIRRIPRERRILMRKRSKLKAQYLKATLPTKSLRIREKLLNIEKQLQRSLEILLNQTNLKLYKP